MQDNHFIELFQINEEKTPTLTRFAIKRFSHAAQLGQDPLYKITTFLGKQ